MEIVRPKGIIKFLVAYLILVVISLVSYLPAESISSVILVGFMYLILVKLAYPIFWGRLGVEYTVLLVFCMLVFVINMLLLIASFSISLQSLRYFLWAFYCGFLFVYIRKIKTHEFFIDGNP